MSEVEYQSIYKLFNETKKEYIQLLSELKTTCLGDTLSDKCYRAISLNAALQTYLVQMSNIVYPDHTDKEKISYLSQELKKDNEQLKSLETSKAIENDNQVIATMNYSQSFIWFIVCIAIVLVIYNQSLILFFGCIAVGLLCYHQLWYVACIAAGLLFCYFATKT